MSSTDKAIICARSCHACFPVEAQTEAFRGADAVFAMLPGSPPNAPDYLADQARMTASLVQAIKASGVGRILALSAQGFGLRSGSVAALTGMEESLRSIDGLSLVRSGELQEVESPGTDDGLRAGLHAEFAT